MIKRGLHSWRYLRYISNMTEHNFPKTLKSFGYDFDAGGKLRKIDPRTDTLTEEGFKFNVRNDAVYNQQRYEALGEVITQYVYGLLEDEDLRRLPVPREDFVSLDSHSFIYASEDALECEKLVALVHGSGVVRAGQWARRLIINDNLSTGTQLPYIRKAKELGYGILVLNTNDNLRVINGKTYKIQGSEDPHTHMESVWKDYIKPSKSKYVAIIAHSYGGECVVKLGMKYPEEFQSKVNAIAFTDSVHLAPSTGFDHIVKVARNWCCANKPLDSPIFTPVGDVERVSAGHTVHEMSSASCMESVFKFLEERYKALAGTS